MGMSFAGRGEWEWQNTGRTPGMRMGFAGRGNGNDRTRNGSLPLTVLISSREVGCVSSVHQRKTTYIITECIKINVTIS
jgi:hypothetical protein